MPLMKLACTASERVPVTRPKVIENLMQKFHQDLVYCRAPRDNDLTRDLRGVYNMYNNMLVFCSNLCDVNI